MYALAAAAKQSPTDEQIIQHHLATRPSYCFEMLYNRYYQKVYRRCLSMTRDADQAQDYAHDIFIRMFARLDKFQGRSAFSTWLYSIAYNYVLDQLRLSKRLPTDQLDETYDYPGLGGSDDEVLESTLHELSQAMNGLSSQDADILRLKYQEGMDVRQIGDHLQLQESAVKMRLKRSRDRVKRLCEVARA